MVVTVEFPPAVFLILRSVYPAMAPVDKHGSITIRQSILHRNPFAHQLSLLFHIIVAISGVSHGGVRTEQFPQNAIYNKGVDATNPFLSAYTRLPP